MHRSTLDSTEPDPDRFTLGTLAHYPSNGPPDGELCAAVLDEQTGNVFPFGRWDAAKTGIAEMRRNPDAHHYAHVIGPRDGFTPAEPGVDEGASR